MRDALSRTFLWLALLRAMALVAIARGLTDGITETIDGRPVPTLSVALALAGFAIRALVEWRTAIVAQRDAEAEKSRLRADLLGSLLSRGRAKSEIADGEIVYLATKGLDGLDARYSQFLPAVSVATVVPLAIGVTIGLTDWVSGVILLITLPLVPLFMWLVGTYTENRVERSLTSVLTLSAHLVELARGLPVLVGLHRADEQIDALQTISDRVRTHTMHTLRTVFLSSLALELLSTLSVAVVAVFIGVRLVWGNMALVDGLFVLLLAPECFTPLRQLGSAFHAAEDGSEAAGRVEGLIESSGQESEAVSNQVTVRDLTVHYTGRTVPAITAFSLTVAPGEVVALTGPSGCGKSTIIAAIAGLLQDGSNQRVHGEVHVIDPSSLAYVPQVPRFVMDTVREEIAFAAADGGDAIDFLTRAGANHVIDRRVSELSLGEARRVAFARALARIDAGAKVVLLDEPTAHLDSASAARIRNVIAALRGSCTVILAAHDSATVALADRAISVAPSANPESDPAFEETSGWQRELTVQHTLAPAITWREALEMSQLLQRSAWIALGTSVLAALAAVALLSLSGWLIVRASEQPPVMYLLVAIVGVRFFGIGRAVLRYLERLETHRVILSAMGDVRMRVWRALAGAGPRNAIWLRSGMAMEALVGHIDTLRDLAPRVFVPPVVAMIATLVIGMAMIGIEPTVGVTVLAGLLLAIGVGAIATVWADQAASQRERLARSEVMQFIGGVVPAAPDIRGNGLVMLALAQLAANEQRVAALVNRGAWSVGLGSALTTIIVGATATLSLVIGAHAQQNGRITDALLAVLVLTPLAMLDPIGDMLPGVRQWPQLRHSTGVLHHILSSASPGIERDPTQIQSLRLHSVCARWPAMDKPVLRDISVALKSGDWLAVTGPSGAGKSTLFALLMGFLEPESGSITINDGIPMGPNSRVAWVPQEAYIFDSTIRGNLLIARPRQEAPTDAEMAVALETVGLQSLLDASGKGLELQVGPAGAAISGGQRTRLAIARALLADADVLLLDEPTAHLDRDSARQVLLRVQARYADRIVIAISHHAQDVGVATHHLNLG